MNIVLDLEDDDEIEYTVRYQDGWRLGMFDKCNGKVEREWENVIDDDADFVIGYSDAYAENEIRI